MFQKSYKLYHFFNWKFFAFFFNFFIFSSNIFFIQPHKIIYNYANIIFRSSEYFSIGLSNRTYKTISIYLNNKYNNKNYLLNNFSLIKKKSSKKKIIIYCVDLYPGQIQWLNNLLKNNEDFTFVLDSENPDYLLFNKFGENHLNPKYKNAIKIAFYTENKIPDLNEADYAIGHQHINYLDRYFKYSIFLKASFQNIKNARKNAFNNPMRKKFCAAVISNSHYSFRNIFINELNKYKKIDMGGKYGNNVGGKVNNKIKFLSSYKFSIAMENSDSDGYISEKIVDAFNSGTIPIYYGDYMLDEYINPKSYILVKGEKDLKRKIEYIKEIDNDDEKYKNFLKEKVLIDDNIAYKNEIELKNFLFHIFEQEKLKAFRTNI